jgi:hypothetical protein
MFVAQGTAQYEIWTGKRAPEAVMRKAVLLRCKPRKGPFLADCEMTYGQ